MTTSETFQIPEENMGRFKAIIGRINARATKLGFDPVVVEIGEGVKKTVRDDSAVDLLNEYILVLMYPVTVTGAQPVLSGYRFAGKVEHMPGTSETIVKGSVPSQYHQCEPNCDHCQVNRQRAETVILQHIESGEYKQVGKSCLKDFFNGDDPMKHAAFMQFLISCTDELRGMEEFERSGGSRTQYVEPMDVLPLAAAVIRTEGYITSGRAEELGCLSTGALIRDMFAPRSKAKKPEITDADRAKAQAVLAWLDSDEAKSKKSDSAYMHNLCVMASTGLVQHKNIAIMASAVVAYDKNEAEKQRNASIGHSKHVGEIEAKVGPLPVTITALIVIPSEMYGDKTLVKMADDDGNQFAWFTSGAEIADVGDRVHITATVKGHDEYRGVKQTTLLRVSALENTLCAAVETGKDAKAIKKLLKETINLDHVGIRLDRTALMLAAREGRDEIVDVLLEAGASPDAALSTGETAAMMAAAAGFAATVEKLEKWGANLELRSHSGDTAASLLKEAQADLQAKAARFEAACADSDGHVPAVDLSWSKIASFPIASLGKTVKEWSDEFAIMSAAAEEMGNSYEFAHSLTDHFRPPIVIVQHGGKRHLWNGADQIGNAAHGGEKTVAVVLGSDLPEFAASSVPAVPAKGLKVKSKRATASTHAAPAPC